MHWEQMGQALWPVLTFWRQQSHYQETVFLPLSFQVFLVLVWSTSECIDQVITLMVRKNQVFLFSWFNRRILFLLSKAKGLIKVYRVYLSKVYKTYQKLRLQSDINCYLAWMFLILLSTLIVRKNTRIYKMIKFTRKHSLRGVAYH